MKQHGNKTSRSRVMLGFLYGFSLTVTGLMPIAWANAEEILRDPTRPPSIVSTPQERETVSVGPVLQSVSLVSGRRTAMINGQPVKLGTRVGDARVVSISETEVVLKTGNSLQTLKLFPDVEKHSITKIRLHKH